jgi:hypothetical protein
MLSFAFIVLITGISIFISYALSTKITWFTYYLGGVVGLFISGVVLQIFNKIRRKKELKKKDEKTMSPV